MHGLFFLILIESSNHWGEDWFSPNLKGVFWLHPSFSHSSILTPMDSLPSFLEVEDFKCHYLRYMMEMEFFRSNLFYLPVVTQYSAPKNYYLHPLDEASFGWFAVGGSESPLIKDQFVFYNLWDSPRASPFRWSFVSRFMISVHLTPYSFPILRVGVRR